MPGMDGLEVLSQMKQLDPEVCVIMLTGMADPVDSKPDHLVFNRTVTLRDAWARAQKSPKQKSPKPK